MRILLLFILALCIPSISQAQTAYETGAMNPLADSHYRQIIDKAKHEPYGDAFPFFELRNHYARSSDYVSRSENIIKELLRLTFLIEHEQDLKAIDAHVRTYRDIIETHLGNIEVMRFALDQAIKDPRFGDAGWIGWLYKGMVRSLTLDRDGKSVRQAYRVISFDEEAFLFEYLKLEKLKTKLVTAGDDSFLYHRHIVHPKGKNPDRTSELYVDVTYPLSLLE